MAEGLIIPPGGGRTLITSAQEVTFKVTGGVARAGSVFEVVVPPGFDVGAHVHAHSEEVFYVLEGELELFAFEPDLRTGDTWRHWQAADGRGPVRAPAGSCMFVPAGCPHAFTNQGEAPARMLFQSAPPPYHESYFEELIKIFEAETGVNADEVARLREKYDIEQITPLRFEPPAGTPGAAAP